jgi:hypothetical protein
MKLVVFLICSGVGYLLGQYLPEPWASYVSILVSYHLFLAWLVITADHDAGFSMPVLSTVLTHAACLAILIGLAMGRRYVPFLSLVRLFVPGLAPFECNWLFAGGTVREKVPEEPIDTAAVAETPVAPTNEATIANTASAVPEAEYTADEHTEWIRYLGRPRRAFRKPGVSVEEEYKQWWAARAEYKALLAQNRPSE